jgi:MFS family permease
MGGMFPILIPLLALERFSTPGHVGLVMAAFNLGGLMAPLFGGVADRYQIHRNLLSFGLLITATALAVLSFATTFAVCLCLAFIQGIGVAVAVTLGSLFIVEIHPKAEWSERIGWLQTFNGGGQVSGMLLAAALSQIKLSSSLLIGSAMIVGAVLPSRLTPKPPCRSSTCSRLASCSAACGETKQSHLHCLSGDSISKLVDHFCTLRSTPFAYFMGVWFLCLAGASSIQTLYPVIMQEVYGIERNLLAFSFAVAMGFSVFLNPQAGHFVRQFGPTTVFQSFLGVRLVAFISFFVFLMIFSDCPYHSAILSFSAVVLCSPFLMVGGTALSALLSPFGKGEGMGIFSAVFSMACVTGSGLGGLLASHWNYNAVAGMAVVTEMLGFILMYRTTHCHCFSSTQAVAKRQG